MDALLKVVEAAYDDCTGRWTGAYWHHYLVYNGVPVCDKYGDPIDCWGDQKCDVCAQGAAMAAEAESVAKEALELARQGQWTEAYLKALDAWDAELPFDPDPCWGQFCDALYKASDVDYLVRHAIQAAKAQDWVKAEAALHEALQLGYQLPPQTPRQFLESQLHAFAMHSVGGGQLRGDSDGAGRRFLKRPCGSPGAGAPEGGRK
jgi:hypothetical protein